MNFISLAPSRPISHRRAFTLVEVITTLAVACLLLASIATIVVMSSKVIRKNVLAEDAVTATRLFQEHLNKEISMAVSDPSTLAPQYSGPSSTTPVRYSRLTYRLVIGPYGKVRDATSMSSTTLILSCPAGLSPQAGDYLMMDSPNFGTGARMIVVDDQRAPNTQGDITVTLGQSIANSTTGTQSDVLAGTAITIQRQRAYQTADSTKYPGLVEMRWYPTTVLTSPPSVGDTETYIIISSNVAESSRYPFIQVPGPMPSPAEPAVGWEFTYATAVSSGPFAGGRSGFYEANHTEGLIMPKSGNPMSAVSIMGSTTSISTSTTSTTSTSSTSTSTTTSTTSTSTTSTTSSSTSTSTSTTSTTSTKTTTSTSTSTSTTSTSSTSTTSTKTTSTTSTSTSKTTTTSTSSTKTTTTSTKSTTSTKTTTTSTKSTTSTSTSSKSTTSTTTSSTTTTSTSTSTSTTTSSTSTIDFDG